MAGILIYAAMLALSARDYQDCRKLPRGQPYVALRPVLPRHRCCNRSGSHKPVGDGREPGAYWIGAFHEDNVKGIGTPENILAVVMLTMSYLAESPPGQEEA